MTTFSRFLMVLAATFIAVNPVMACCLSGHTTPELSSAVQPDVPPCHGEAPAPPADSSACPGCGDCESSLMSVSSLDLAAAVLRVLDADLAESSDGRPALAGSPTVVRATGPPRSLVDRPSTPITLKQRLLI